MPERGWVFFDLGWTLEDETQAQFERAEQAAALVAQYGIETTAQDLLALEEQGAREMAPSVFRYALAALGLDEEQQGSVMQRARWNPGAGSLVLYPDAKHVLETLSRTHGLGLIANQSPGTEARLCRYGIRDYFALVLASADLGIEKPDPRIFALAQEKAACAANRIWMVGDRIDNDIRPANQIGWQTVRILNGYNTFQNPRCKLEEPDFSIGSLTELLGIVR